MKALLKMVKQLIITVDTTRADWRDLENPRASPAWNQNYLWNSIEVHGIIDNPIMVVSNHWTGKPHSYNFFINFAGIRSIKVQSTLLNWTLNYWNFRKWDGYNTSKQWTVIVYAYYSKLQKCNSYLCYMPNTLYSSFIDSRVLYYLW